MLRIDQIRLLPDEPEAQLPHRCARILRVPAEAIGGAVGMTGIRVEGPSWLPLLWLLGLAALAAAVALGIRLLRARRREGGCEE